MIIMGVGGGGWRVGVECQGTCLDSDPISDLSYLKPALPTIILLYKNIFFETRKVS